ncbi:MAG: hypothetical protein HY290_01475 [Planctomycetia bacterium]|nr:hypothetical protein [Planctomycetia bacterium]
MGLDIFEISIELERKFGIKFERDEHLAAFCDTAGTLCEFVWQKLQGIRPAIPDLMEIYQQVSDFLNTAPHRRWFVGGRVERFLSREDLGTDWKWLEQSLGVTLPALVRDAKSGRDCVPRECLTSFQIATWIAKNYPERVVYLRTAVTNDPPAGARRFSREDCWIGVKEVLIDALGVKPHEVVPEAHLINDLGMD